MKESKGFKETEIGLIPEDWEVVKLGEVGNYINGYAFKPSDWSNTGKPIIRIQNLNNPSASFNYFNGELDYKYLVKKGDILISWSASLGAYLWNGEDAWLNQHIFKVELTNQNVAKDFLYFALLYYFVGQALANLHGSTMKHIVKSKFLNILIPLPPLEEQRVIADILSTVQNNIEKTEKVINATKQLKKSMMKHLFTYGAVEVDEIDKVKLKESEIGLIPEHWEVVMLGEVVEIYDNKRVPLSESVRKNMKGVYPYCGANGIIDYVNDYIFDGEYVLVAEDGGRYGKFENTAYIMNGKFWVNNHAHILQAKVGISINRFILHWFTYADISQYVSGTTRQKLTLSTLKSFPISLPPLDEQQKIANILTTIDQKIQAEENKKEALQNLFKTLLQQLMTGKIRVKKAKT